MPDIPQRNEYALIIRQPLSLREMGSRELMGINQNAREQLNIYLERLRMTEIEILRRDTEGIPLDNTDFDYEIIPSAYSESETEVKVVWKLGCRPEWLDNTSTLDRSTYGRHGGVHSREVHNDGENYRSRPGPHC